MSALFSSSNDHPFYAEDDYRAYLIHRHPRPVAHHSVAMRVKRFRVHVRSIVHVASLIFHRVVRAMQDSKMRAVERELRMRGIPCDWPREAADTPRVK